MQSPLLDFSRTYPSIDPDAFTINTTSVPVNGSSFSSGQIFVDLPKQDVLVPDSLYIKYCINYTTGTAAGFIEGCPVFTPFYRLETLCNNVNIESIPQYNLLQNLISNITLDRAQKLGNESSYGYLATAGTNIMHGRQMAAVSDTFTVTAPLNCILSNVKNSGVPLGAMPQVRLVFTLDSMTNMMGYVATSTNTSFTITNFEVGYELYHAPSQYLQSLLQMDNKAYLKSISYANVAQSVPIGSSGTLSLNYNINYNSIKSAFLHFSPTGYNAVQVNGQYDSYDLTQNSGDYQLIIGGQPYPSKPLSAINTVNRSGILTELRKAATTFGQEYWCIFDKQNTMDISKLEFDNCLTHTTATTLTQPSKFYVGVHTEKLHNNTSVLSGIPSRGSAIIARINCPTATASTAFNVNLILVFDTLIEIDFKNQQVSVKQ